MKKAKTENPYLKNISEIKNLHEEIEEHEQELVDLKNKGYNPLTIFERFEKANMKNEYRSLYNFLCSDAHSNIRALVDRHLEIHEDGFTVVYYKDVPLESFLTYLDSTAGLVTNASVRIHSFFETGQSNEIDKLAQKLNEIRSRY